MVARYKLKKLIIEMCDDSSKRRGSRQKVAGAERAYAKKLVRSLVEEHADSPRQDKEDQFDIDMALDLWCYEQGCLDPNYVCRCFEKKGDI